MLTQNVSDEVSLLLLLLSLLLDDIVVVSTSPVVTRCKRPEVISVAKLEADCFINMGLASTARTRAFGVAASDR